MGVVRTRSCCLNGRDGGRKNIVLLFERQKRDGGSEDKELLFEQQRWR